jgi:hypothetical protein
MTDPIPADVRTFWMGVALGLKDELVKRGNRIEALERELAAAQSQCRCRCHACKYCEQLLEPEATP